MKAKVLFLCTGNYYRSRFAELLFNHWAAQQGLNWVADSRGLAIELGVNNIGPISSYAVEGLQALSIVLDPALRFPQQVQEADLQEATLVIALDRQEHQAYVEARIPDWATRIRYWEVADLHLMTATEALARIEEEVQALLKTCTAETTG